MLDPDQIEVRARPIADKKAASARRKMREDFGKSPPPAPRSGLVDLLGSEYPIPDWLVTEEFKEELVGPVKGGKEGYVELVHRYSSDRSCLLARKSYVERKRRNFQNDRIYREGRRFTRDSRELRAIERGTSYGRTVLTGDWFDTEFKAMRKLWLAGADVPYPVSFEGSLLMQFVGDWDRAAPRLVDARIDRSEADGLLDQILDNVRLCAREEVVHGDLSAYNILYWEGRAWIIDLPQSVNLFLSPHGVDLLRRDIANVCTYFKRFGVERDIDEELAIAVGGAYGG